MILSFIASVLLVLRLSLLLRPRRFYFVRHGETVLNAERVKQGVEGALSEKGRAQAADVGRYLTQFRIKGIVSSTYPRAKETAEILATYLHAPIRYSPLLVERRNPQEVIGKPVDDPEVTRIVDQIEHSYHVDDYRFSDEENFIDLKTRAQRALRFLASRGGRETCVVTHHVFLKMLIAYMLYHDRLHAADFTKLSFFNVADNAGITVCEFRPLYFFTPTRGWRVLSYNERIA